MHVQGRSLHAPGASLPVARRSDTMEECANQCCHNELDATKGRQLPMHIGSPSLHCQYVKSNLGQQVPAANGAAYAMKLMNKTQPNFIPLVDNRQPVQLPKINRLSVGGG